MILKDLDRLDYRNNLIVDPDNPILVQKAWRDRYSKQSHWNAGYGGESYLSRKNSEDALTWNVFRSLQLMGLKGLSVIEKVFDISSIQQILFWGCDVQTTSDVQQILNSLIRAIDGRHEGTMTEPDIVLITENEVAFVECKLNKNGKQSPWKAQGAGAQKRLSTYMNVYGFHELSQINDWEKVYQMIRQYVYSKSLAEALGKKPLVFPLVNKDHVPIWNEYYESLRKWKPKIIRPFVTWQNFHELLRDDKFINLSSTIYESLLAAS